MQTKYLAFALLASVVACKKPSDASSLRAGSSTPQDTSAISNLFASAPANSINVITKAFQTAGADKDVTPDEARAIMTGIYLNNVTLAESRRFRDLTDPDFWAFSRDVERDTFAVFATFAGAPAQEPTLPAPPPLAASISGAVFMPVDGDVMRVSDAINLRQGLVNDSYFLATVMAAQAKGPRFHKRIVQNDDGTFGVKFFNCSGSGQGIAAETVQVNGSLPVYTGNKLVGAHNKDAMEMWPSIVEKAYATWKGGYDKIEDGSPSLANALCENSGVAVESVSDLSVLPDQGVALFDKMRAYDLNKQPMVATTGAEVGATGLQPNTTYAVSQAILRDKGTTRIIELRATKGPAGEPASNGSALDGDPDGEFRINYEYFLRYFQKVDMASTKPADL